ncbi:DUF1345 domain-containing protein [Paludisphaera mucosa]|uniref:DUF1345 domain-containing protein n=1 Tax=Paludisphaera mucosa TaxID=3030827 RepID=A0ABT6FAM2_9BACT|nr:DUF1345 domain-containing protein [Paludisphaera mucosa]MDG3004438.1 DUF1345 domain-containing protein [Paludisphaera mucosa]
MRMNLLASLKTQPRLVTAVVLGVLLWFVLPGWPPSTRLLAAWDCSTGLYLVLAMGMMARSTIDRIRGRAESQDEGQLVILGLTTVTALVSLGGIMFELATAKSLEGRDSWRHVALAAMTVVLSWTFLHTMFAVHYAHEYYSPEGDGASEGLEFPGDDDPDYWDFMYYAFVIGTACATADVNVASRLMRRLTALHCIIAFFFNTTILALMVNIGAGFF